MSINGQRVNVDFSEYDGDIPTIVIRVSVGPTLIGVIHVPSHESLSPEVKTLIGRICTAAACSILKDAFKR